MTARSEECYLCDENDLVAVDADRIGELCDACRESVLTHARTSAMRPPAVEYRGETMAVVADTPDDYAADMRLSRLLECVRWSIADRARFRSACAAHLAMHAPIEDSAAWAAIEYDTSWIAGATAVVAAALAVREGDIERAARVLAEYNAEDIDAWEALVRADMARRGGA